MIKNAYRYIRQMIDMDQFLEDTRNDFTLVSQRPSKAKIADDGSEVVPPGVTVTLQINQDYSAPVVDKETGEIKDDNRLETFDATIVGVSYPLPIVKGSRVRLGEFMPNISYYINFSLILRFANIEMVSENEIVTD